MRGKSSHAGRLFILDCKCVHVYVHLCMHMYTCMCMLCMHMWCW